MNEMRNARIESTMLGYEDRGILTCMIGLDYGGSAQGFGGYSFDEPIWEGEPNDSKFEGRYGVAFGMEFIARVLKTVGVERWEDLKGKYVRTIGTWDKVHAIGHIVEDKWFYPANLQSEFGGGKKVTP